MKYVALILTGVELLFTLSARAAPESNMGSNSNMLNPPIMSPAHEFPLSESRLLSLIKSEGRIQVRLQTLTKSPQTEQAGVRAGNSTLPVSPEQAPPHHGEVPGWHPEEGNVPMSPPASLLETQVNKALSDLFFAQLSKKTKCDAVSVQEVLEDLPDSINVSLTDDFAALCLREAGLFSNSPANRSR
jgi:hypothetical protein